MSVRVMGLIWPLEIEPLPKLVLLKLADHADDDGGSIFPAVDSVAHHTGLSPRTVQRYLRSFEADGFLVLVGNASGGRNRARIYRLNLQRILAQPERVTGASPLAPESAENGGSQGERVTACHPLPRNGKRVTATTERVTATTLKGDRAVSPEPSLTIIEPGGARAREGLAKGSRARTLDELAITGEVEAWARKHAPPGIDLGHELEAFKVHCQAHGRHFDDWAAGFRSWLLKAERYGGAAGAPGAGRTPAAGPVSDDLWRERVADYWNGGRRDGPWLDSWGFRPGEPGCAAPPEVLAGVLGDGPADRAVVT